MAKTIAKTQDLVQLKEKPERAKALQKALADIEKEYGKGAIMKMGEKPNMDIQTISSGILSLDMALGVGGFPRGRIVEVYGPESTGKTTIALQTVAECQREGGTVAYIDAENAMDPVYAKALGVDIDSLLLSQPASGEEGLEITQKLVTSGAVDMVVVDSVAALVPAAEIEGQIGDNHVGLQARLMSQALRSLAGEVHKTNTLVVFINQLREKIGVQFGSPDVTPGGRALKFYATIRLEVRRGEFVKDGKENVGFVSKLKVVKNKVAPPFKVAETTMYFGHGIEKNADMIALGSSDAFAVVKKSGSWYSYQDTRLGQGPVNAAQFLNDHPDTAAAIEADIRAKADPPKDDDQIRSAADDKEPAPTKPTAANNTKTEDIESTPAAPATPAA
ncbi:recombinase RecA [Schleiferilactobacillus harbinensis]|uniref:recombinase RecA n=1 Tax=Schleiferilactobacillus harbinensis TaxID=304207 RepID=UPI0024309A14|nr:recombinase RecA [Schleiferilactobacillus harbinensis]MCI1686777.1 recombinase RecA [Schleiferilactobacillus harbinensis]MCI1782652.1 recombinase RecA [Schleiferilactobacillus harbinensis]MCI1849596.1 recombinase RecA [Schleiferilactobacillus harbinensis]